MKRFLSVVLILAFVFMASSGYALDRFSNNQNVKSYVITNATATTKASAVSTSTITVANHRILGYTVQELDPTAAAERIVAIYDSASVGAATATTLLDETETPDNESATRWYPYPMALANGLTVLQGANTIAIIYYEDKREI
jgi:hypothetical protein